MKKLKFLYILPIVVLGYLNINLTSLDDVTDLNTESLTLTNVANAEDPPPDNHWTDWWEQGLTKNEREIQQPCPAIFKEVKVCLRVNNFGVCIESKYEVKNVNEGRDDIRCPVGRVNCSDIRC